MAFVERLLLQFHFVDSHIILWSSILRANRILRIAWLSADSADLEFFIGIFFGWDFLIGPDFMLRLFLALQEYGLLIDHVNVVHIVRIISIKDWVYAIWWIVEITNSSPLNATHLELLVIRIYMGVLLLPISMNIL